MNAQSVRMPIVLLVLALALDCTTCTRSLSQDVDPHQRGNMTLQLADKNPKAKSLAFERYQFVNRLETKFDLPFYSTLETSCFVLFPVGRSDRIYFVLWNGYWPSDSSGRDLILCYQRKNGGDMLVFEINLEVKPELILRAKKQATKKSVKIDRLLDYLHAEGLVIKDKISIYARKDLTMKRDYVQYNYSLTGDWITVYLTSDYYHTFYGADKTREELYELSQDPFTKKPLRKGDFYERYGLPAAKEELKLLENVKAK